MAGGTLNLSATWADKNTLGWKPRGGRGTPNFVCYTGRQKIRWGGRQGGVCVCVCGGGTPNFV